jgi:hypothetical protein
MQIIGDVQLCQRSAHRMTELVLSTEDLAELTSLEESMWRSDKRFDLAFQQRCFAPDFMEFGRSGRVYARDEMILTVARSIDALLPLSDLRVRLLTMDVAQVLYNSRVVCDGVVQHGRRSSIWSRTPTGWELRFHQGTPYEP